MDKQLLKKINDGDGITDEELDTALEFFTDLEQKLNLMGSHFYHPWLDVRMTLDRLQGFKRARQERR